MDEFGIVTLMRSVMWIVLSLVLLVGSRDYFKVHNTDDKITRNTVRLFAWLFILMNIGVFIYILMRM